MNLKVAISDELREPKDSSKAVPELKIGTVHIMKPRISALTESEAAFLAALGKYRGPIFWVRDERTWADAAQVRAYSEKGKEVAKSGN